MIYTCDVLFFESDEMFDIVSQKKKKVIKTENAFSCEKMVNQNNDRNNTAEEFTVLIMLNDCF